MKEKLAMVGVVIRADGTVPFDEDCHPDVKGAILAHLAEQGHTLEPVMKDGRHTGHMKIKNYVPPKPKPKKEG